MDVQLAFNDIQTCQRLKKFSHSVDVVNFLRFMSSSMNKKNKETL